MSVRFDFKGSGTVAGYNNMMLEQVMSLSFSWVYKPLQQGRHVFP